MALSYSTRASSTVFNGSVSITTTQSNQLVVVFLGVWGSSFSSTAVTIAGIQAQLVNQVMAGGGCSIAAFHAVVPNPGTYSIAWTDPTNAYSIDIMEAVLINGPSSLIAYDSAVGADNTLLVSADSTGIVVTYRQINGSTLPSSPTVSSGEVVNVLNSGTVGNANSWNVSYFIPNSSGAKTISVRSSSSSAYDDSIVLSYKVSNTAPTASVTQPTANAVLDPRTPIDVAWTYSDAESSPQAQREISYKLATDSVYNTISSAATESTTYTIAANTLPDESDIDIAVRVNDGTVWSSYYPVRVRSDSWTYGSQVTTSVQSVQAGPFNWTGDTQIEVRTADAVGFGPWSAPAVTTINATVTAVAGVATLGSAAASYSSGYKLFAVPGSASAASTPANISAQDTIFANAASASLSVALAAVGGAATVHVESQDTAKSPVFLPLPISPTVYWNGLFAVPAGITVGMVEPTRTVYLRPAATVYTDQDYRKRFTDGFTRITRRVEILNSDGSTLWDDKVENKSRLISGSVSVDYTRDERRSLDLELSNFDGALVHQPGGFWYDKVIKCYRGIEFYDKSGVQSYEVPLGSFLIDRVTEARFPKTVKVTARDYTKKCLLSKLTQATAFAANTKMTDVVAALASNAGIHDRIFPNDDSVLGVDYTFDRDTTRWEAMKQIAQAFSYELFFNSYGYLVMRKMLDPTLGPISHEFLTGPSVGNLVDWEKSSNDTRIFNHVSVIGSDTTNLPVWADAYNNNPLSPTNIDTLGDRTQTITSGLVTTTAQAQSLADSMLKIASLEEYEINMSSIVYPWLEAGEIVRFVDPEKIGNEPDRFLLTTLTIPMGLEPMSATGRRILIVS